MEVFTHQETVFNSVLFQDEIIPNSTVGEMVPAFLDYYQKIWWACRSELPEFRYTYSGDEQTVHEKHLDSVLNGLLIELKRIPHNENERRDW